MDEFDRALAQHKASAAPSDPFDAALQASRSAPAPAHTQPPSAPEKPSLPAKLFGTLLRAGQGVPGGKAAEAGFAMLSSRLPGMSSTGPLSYADALESVTNATKAAPGLARAAAAIPGAVVTGAALPALQGWKAISGAGAGLSAADRLLSATDESVGDRLKGTAKAGVVGAIAGPVISKGGDYLNAVARRFIAPTLDANLTARAAARTAASKPLYEQFRAQGDLGQTPALADMLDLPIVQRSVETVKGESPVLAKLPDTDARVLDAAYKRLGSRAFAATHGYEPNEARVAFKQAIDEASGGQFSPAVDTFREHSAPMGAVKRGAQTLVNAARGRTPFNQMDIASPAAFRAFAETATPAEQEAAAEGIAGRLKTAPLTDKLHLPLGIRVPFRPSAAVRAAPALLEQVGAGVSPRVRAVALADLLAMMQPR